MLDIVAPSNDIPMEMTARFTLNGKEIRKPFIRLDADSVLELAQERYYQRVKAGAAARVAAEIRSTDRNAMQHGDGPLYEATKTSATPA